MSICIHKLKHKPKHNGLPNLLFLILFVIFFSSLSAYGGESLMAAPETTDSVIVWAESDVTDFNKFYKPQDHKNVDFLRGDSKWTFLRSKQSEHFIVFWEEGFGENPNSSNVPAALRVDVANLLEKAEEFYDLNIETLGFAEVGVGKSNLDDYKMQIYLFYTENWMAYGAGYDDVIGALWISPSTCKPVGSTIAHEIGHSFQYQVFCDLKNGHGFRYGFGGNGGNGFWEQTAQWQAYQSYPDQVFSSRHYGVYCDNYHRHVCHEMYRYASYFIHYYWTDKHGIDFVGKLWREAKEPEDPMQAYMRITGISVDELNAELYEAAIRNVTWDYDALRTSGSSYFGKHTYRFYKNADGFYQVAYSKCPGTTGYNVVPLNVPEAGTVVTTSFRALTTGSSLANADPGEYTDTSYTSTTRTYNASSPAKAGWRYGYVALLNNGKRIYGEMNRKTAADINFTIPESCSKLWLVVLGAPSEYEAHAWDEKESNDEQWPYMLKFTNTDLLGTVALNPNQTPENLTLTYDVSFKADTLNYSGTIVNLFDNADMSKLAQALALQPSEISAKMLTAKEEPKDNKIAFAAVQSDNSLSYNTSAKGLGFWFDGNGDVIVWGNDNNSKISCEFNSDIFEFSIKQFPGKSTAGDKYTIKEALVYTKEGKQYQVTFVFNISID